MSATSPLIQSWFSRGYPGRNPYVLFALSNLASLLALISFPFFFEPRFSSSFLTFLWSGIFVVYVMLFIGSAWIAAKTPLFPGPLQEKGPVAPLGLWDKGVWVGLSACGSMLLLSVTNHLTQDVAAVPLLWVLPLGVYLISFIIVFGHPSLYKTSWMVFLSAGALVFLNYAFYEPDFLPDLRVKIALLCLGLFLTCVFCHGELALRKPAPVYLTTYYLMISTGGALGAIFVGLFAPEVFSGIYEYPLALILTSLCALGLLWGRSLFIRAIWSIIFLFLLLVLVQNTLTLKKESLLMVRDFYAALRVLEQETPEAGKFLTLCNGVVVHGRQFEDPSRSLEGTTYYAPDSGAALAVRLLSGGPKRVGLIGLGTGTLAVYARKGDVDRFYEINPQVIEVAENYFSFLKKSQALIEIVPGDARLALEAEAPNQFDVLAVDAFSGDAIPVHLLTREAFELYLRHLKPDGILAFHTSNLYLNLAPVVGMLAKSFGYGALLIQNPSDPARLVDSTQWVLVTRNQAFLKEPEISSRGKAIPLPAHPLLWTDDTNSLFSVFK
jgi:SAM-dependent methyltransferase